MKPLALTDKMLGMLMRASAPLPQQHDIRGRFLRAVAAHLRAVNNGAVVTAIEDALGELGYAADGSMLIVHQTKEEKSYARAS